MFIRHILLRHVHHCWTVSKLYYFQTFTKDYVYTPHWTHCCVGCLLQWQKSAFFYLFIFGDRPGFWPRYHQSIAESLTSQPFELRDVVYHWIYILDLFTSVLIERIDLPGVVLNQGLHHWESADLSPAPQRLKENVYLWIYILYFCSCLALGRRNLAPLQVRIPLSPLL